MSGQQSMLYFIKYMSASEAQMRLLNKRKMQKLCYTCGKPLDREGMYCLKCLEKRKKYTNDTRNMLAEHKICPRCWKNDLFGDEKVCLECNARDYANSMKSRERLGKEHYNEMHRIWSKKRHQELIEKGICTRCAKRKADKGFKTCGICRYKLREQKRKGYGDAKQEKWIENGLCRFCGQPVKSGYKVCEKHYQDCIQKLDDPKCIAAREESKKYMKIFFKKY